MTPASFVIRSGALTYGVPLCLAICELASHRPSPARGGDEPPPPSPRQSPSPQPLPDCLQPDRRIVRSPVVTLVRTLEAA